MRDGAITIPWAGSDRRFRLGIGELELLQEAVGAGPYVVLDRLSGPGWRVEDVAHVIRLGLIGGGSNHGKAFKMVREHVESRPPVESLQLARMVLTAACVGVPEDRIVLKKKGVVKGGVQERLDDLPHGCFRFARLYGDGAGMGFTPEEVRRQSLWSFFAARDGWIAANSADVENALSEAEADELWDWLND